MHEQSHTPLKPPRKDFEKGTYALVCWAREETLYEFEEHPLDPCPNWKEVDSWSHDSPEIKQISLPQSTFVQQEDNAGPLPIRQKLLDKEGNLKATLLYMKDFNKLSNEKNTEKNQSETESVGSESYNRELGEIGKDTGHHVALYIVKHLSDGKKDKIPSSEVQNRTPKPDGTIGPSLRDLYERKMLERDESENRPYEYEYWISDYGEVAINEHGRPSDEYLNMQISD
jgi:DNA-binding HxlR family transcriptional regulator